MNDFESAAFTDAVSRTIKGARSTYRNMTQQALATASGVNYETLKKIERGNQKISVAQVAAIAIALGRSPQQLVEDAWALYLSEQPAGTPVSEASATNVIYDPRFQSPEEIDANQTGEARAANAVDDEGGDQPDN